jgi:hypothetical protein
MTPRTFRYSELTHLWDHEGSDRSIPGSSFPRLWNPAQPPNQIQSNKLPNKTIKYAKIVFQSNKYMILDLK